MFNSGAVPQINMFCYHIICQSTTVYFISIYIFQKPRLKVDVFPSQGWNMECLQEWGSFMRLAIPSAFMFCLEWWVYEFGGFFAGQSVSQCTSKTVFTFMSCLFVLLLKALFLPFPRYVRWRWVGIPARRHDAWISKLYGRVWQFKSHFLSFLLDHSLSWAYFQCPSWTLKALTVTKLAMMKSVNASEIFEGSEFKTYEELISFSHCPSYLQ